MFDFSMLQQMFGGGLGQGLLGQQPQMGQQQPAMPGYGPNMGNPYAMGIPTQPQATAPYTQQSPYTQGSPYTQTGWTPSFQDYFSPFQDLRQQWQDKNNADYAAAQQPQVPPNQGQITSDQLAELYSRTNTYNPDGPSVQWTPDGAQIKGHGRGIPSSVFWDKNWDGH